jgi:hypothetical protein
MGKEKVQKTMASFAPPLIGFGSSMVVTIGSLQEFETIVVAYTNENLYEIICTSTNLLVSWSYV